MYFDRGSYVELPRLQPFWMIHWSLAWVLGSGYAALALVQVEPLEHAFHVVGLIYSDGALVFVDPDVYTKVLPCHAEVLDGDMFADLLIKGYKEIRA